MPRFRVRGSQGRAGSLSVSTDGRASHTSSRTLSHSSTNLSGILVSEGSWLRVSSFKRSIAKTTPPPTRPSLRLNHRGAELKEVQLRLGLDQRPTWPGLPAWNGPLVAGIRYDSNLFLVRLQLLYTQYPWLSMTLR